MRTIGLVGGIGSGKSTVARMLEDLGAAVLDADRAGHRALQEPAVRDILVDRWGDDILDGSGQVDRTLVAARVFGDSAETQQERRFLEDVVHPRIRARLEGEINALPDVGAPAVVIDAALLFEAGWDHICQMVLFVDCPREVRQARALQRGWSAEEFAAREAAQMPIDEKRGLAGYVVENGGSLEMLRQHVGDFWNAQVDSTAD